MSKRPQKQLIMRKVASLKDSIYGDGGNLWVTIRGTNCAWSFRYKSPLTDRRREMVEGPARDVSLSEAHSKDTNARRFLLEVNDPLEEQAKRLLNTI
ncbi:integrase arm-type DNA-binding domain-containing protein [Acetobacter tropicalis]|uniref:integrase arm-type DNA-binding domain-containing protein n=1 Tax=Acetobacter tropicalis TaxID=104102 RepID=UPI0020CE5877|nr:integrase arm-type DNA-binding domain-containing protein [Acetobacter tropicalis]